MQRSFNIEHSILQFSVLIVLMHELFVLFSRIEIRKSMENLESSVEKTVTANVQESDTGNIEESAAGNVVEKKGKKYSCKTCNKGFKHHSSHSRHQSSCGKVKLSYAKNVTLYSNEMMH